MVKTIGIIRCDSHSENCAGFNCFPALRNKTGQFENYDKVELGGFDTCGGCDLGKSEKIVSKVNIPSTPINTWFSFAETLTI